MNEPAVIDSHQHCWQLDRPECRWPTPELSAIYRDFGPGDYRREAAPAGVDASVLVQSQPDERDTDYLLSLAEASPGVLGVVGWLDLAAPDAAARVVATAERPGLCGLRPMLEAIERDDWILECARPEALALMAEWGLAFDALIRPRHLGVINVLARRHPELIIVIDHAAKPDIGAGQWRDWHEGLAALAARPNVLCKLSGLVTEMAPGQPLDELAPYARAVLELFGPERVLWGSDWPVLRLAGDFHRWLTLARERVADFDPAAEPAVFADNARRCYRLAGSQ